LVAMVLPLIVVLLVAASPETTDEHPDRQGSA
jgi:hypothetical protein